MQEIEHQVYTDKYGRRYSAIVIKDIPLNFADGNENHVWKGDFKIKLRNGNSCFGEELLFELWNARYVKSYKQKSPRKEPKFEIYLFKEIGIKMLKEAVKKFEDSI